MARIGLKHTNEVPTRDKYTKVNMELGLVIDGREIPNAAVLGSALEDAVKLIQERIAESYRVVPARVETPADAVVTSNPTATQPVVAAQPAQATATQPASGLGFPPQYNAQ
jgi:septal ring-binding cell division protein DamX